MSVHRRNGTPYEVTARYPHQPGPGVDPAKPVAWRLRCPRCEDHWSYLTELAAIAAIELHEAWHDLGETGTFPDFERSAFADHFRSPQ